MKSAGVLLMCLFRFIPCICYQTFNTTAPMRETIEFLFIYYFNINLSQIDVKYSVLISLKWYTIYLHND